MLFSGRIGVRIRDRSVVRLVSGYVRQWQRKVVVILLSVVIVAPPIHGDLFPGTMLLLYCSDWTKDVDRRVDRRNTLAIVFEWEGLHVPRPLPALHLVVISQDNECYSSVLLVQCSCVWHWRDFFSRRLVRRRRLHGRVFRCMRRISSRRSTRRYLQPHSVRPLLQVRRIISARHIYTELMYKTAVCTVVNDVITHQKPLLSKNVILRSMTLPKCQCTAEQYHLFDICCFWWVMTPLTSV